MLVRWSNGSKKYEDIYMKIAIQAIYKYIQLSRQTEIRGGGEKRRYKDMYRQTDR